MSRLTPVSRQEFISRLKELGFDGPHSGGKHQYMIKGSLRLTVPNPHKKEISFDLLTRLLKQAGISRDEWTRK
jgi:predicted RNA binding protein YcfA (HicA-like mRNA interferase family)